MPRSLKDILENADELAARFEGDFEGDEVPIAEHRLQMAALARAQAERQLAEAVEEARADGLSWKRIGSALGTSPQAAQARYKDVKIATATSMKSKAKSIRRAVSGRTKAGTALGGAATTRAAARKAPTSARGKRR